MGWGRQNPAIAAVQIATNAIAHSLGKRLQSTFIWASRFNIIPEEYALALGGLIKTEHGNTRELAIQRKSIVDRRRDVTYAHWGT